MAALFGGRVKRARMCVLVALVCSPSASAALAVVATGTATFHRVPGTPVTTPLYPEQVTFRPTGGLLAVADAGQYPLYTGRGLATAITMFSVGTGGRLTREPSSVFGPGAGKGSYPLSVEFSPNGKLLTGVADGKLLVFSVGARGQLRTVASWHFTGPTEPWAAHFSPNGKLLAVANLGGRPNRQSGGTVSMFAVGSRGSLTEVAGSPFEVGGSFGEAQDMAFSPDGHFVAVSDGDEARVLLYAVDAGGALSTAPIASAPTGRNPNAIEFNPQGTLVAVGAEDSHQLDMFTVGATGALAKAPGSPHPGITGGGSSLAFAPGGKLLAMATGSHNTVIFDVLASGALRTTAVLRTAPVLQSPNGIEGVGAFGVGFSPNGGMLAVANYGEDNVSLYSIRR